ncbi:MAG: DUF4037 domain-containing protein [Dehalococcoidia bacterium]
MATEIAASCPPEIAQEIFLAGSVSRGWADEFSDLELNFIADPIPTEEERNAWLGSIGADPIIPDSDWEPHGSQWVIFCYDGVWVEAGWHEPSQLLEAIEQILAGKGDPDRLAGALAYCIPLRPGPSLKQLRRRLSVYPKELRAASIQRELRGWRFPHYLAGRRAMVERNDSLQLAVLLLQDCKSVLRVLFALNHRWEPNFKWLSHIEDQLAIKPANLAERLESVLVGEEPHARVTAMLALVRDTLALVEPSEERERALAIFSEQINGEPESPGR